MSQQPITAHPVPRLAAGWLAILVWLALASRVGAADESSSSRPARDAAAAREASRAGVIRFLEDRVGRDPDDIVALNRLSGEYLGRFRTSGDDADLTRAARAAERSLAAVPAEVNKAGLAARARAAFTLHQFAAARDDARELLRLDPRRRYPLEILGDALLELGNYDDAADVYARMREFGESDPTVEVRLARLAMVNGDREAASRHLNAAVDLAKDAEGPGAPEVLAWTRVRAGHFAFSSGDWPSAESHYRAALDASPDDWPALDHLAELRAAQRRHAEAVGIYEPLAARVPRPELFQSLGDVYAAMGRPQDATTWRRKALESYLRATAAGSEHYHHHLAGFYSDSLPDAEQALRWARRDLELRRTVATLDALAWALHAAGKFTEAAAAMDEALGRASVADAHVLYHASLIYFKAGNPAKGKDCLQRAASANPTFNEFHVHR